MNFRKMIAGVAAAVTAAVSLVIPASAEMIETDISYTGPTAGAMSVGDNGCDIRLNIFNEWTSTKIKDINNKGAFSDFVKVDFTIEGLGDRHCLINDDGTEGDAFSANLGGSIGTTEAFTGNPETAINGDGQYTVEFPLEQSADTILCLYIQSNINKYNIENEGKDVVFKVDRIYTMAEEAPEFEQGDVDQNHTINIFDAVMIAKYTVHKVDLTDAQLALADMDGKNGVNIFDAVAVAKLSLK